MKYRDKVQAAIDAFKLQLGAVGSDPRQDAVQQEYEGGVLLALDELEHYMKFHRAAKDDCFSVRCIHSGHYEVE
jgi:hypothetical protein